MKNLPTFYGFKVNLEDRYEFAQQRRLFRLGIKLNTPNVCTWSCPYCYMGSSNADDRPRLLAGEELAGEGLNKDPAWAERMKGWIRQGIDLGVKAITLNGTFEPTTSPNYMEIIRFCRENDLWVTLVTNGSTLNRARLEDLYELEVNILTKINVPMVHQDDPRYNLFCEIQKELSGRGNAQETYEFQRWLIEEMIDVGFNRTLDPAKTRMGVESVITTSNIEYLPELVLQLRDQNIYAHIEVTKVQGFAHNNRYLAPSKAQLQGLFEVLADQDKSIGFEPWEPRPPYVASSCHENLFRLDIHANGTVRPCPGVEVTLGDLNHDAMAEIVRHDKLDIIRNLEHYIEGDCRNCELFQTRECYGGCRGTVFQTLKSQGFSEREALVASDPSCWKVNRVLDNGTSADIFDRSLQSKPLPA